MNKLKKNFIYLSLYKILEMLLPMITSPLLSRRLGAEALGTYSYTYSIVSIFAVIAQLGIYNYGMREIAKVRDDKEKLNQTYSDIFFVHIISSILVTIIYFFSIFLFFNKDILIFIIQGGVLLSVILDNAFLFVGIENVKTITIRDAIAKFTTFILVILLVKNSNDLILYSIIMVLGTLVCRMISLIYARKFVRLVKPSIKRCKRHIKPMIILMIPILASTIYQSMDKIMIEFLYGKEYVGYYECASKGLIPRNIITVLGTVMCPHIANLYAQGQTNIVTKKVNESLTFSMVMSYVFAFGITSIAKEFSPWFWGKDFSVCSPMLIGISFTIPCWTIGEVIRNQYLLPIGRDKEYMISFVLGVIVNLILNFILIPQYGAIGAIVSTIIAELVMSTVQMYLARGKINYFKSIMDSMPYLFISIIMLIFVRLISKIITGNLFKFVVVEVITGAILYVLLVSIYELATKKKLILNVILKNKLK